MIKKLAIVLLVLMFGNTLYGQTLEETKDWIKEKLETFRYQEPGFPNVFTVSFDDENITFHFKRTSYGSTYETETTIPVKEMQQIRFSENKNTVWIVFRVKNGKDIKYLYNQKIELKNETNLIMDKDILNDDLEERLKKAFKSLISSYGGSLEEAY